MNSLPDILKIPDGPEKLSLPSANLPVSDLIKFPLPPQRKSTVFTDPTDYLCDPPSKHYCFRRAGDSALGRAILQDPEIASIVLVHSPAHRDKGDRYPALAGYNLVSNGTRTRGANLVAYRHGAGGRNAGKISDHQSCSGTCRSRATGS
ncbi:hypothetical protein B0H14DRAFT_3147664 [Mycena olivaceomarginata]|nr:hypothetical protein B0H14DRAFT_3147664 [Mycena olivaceomarginata]